MQRRSVPLAMSSGWCWIFRPACRVSAQRGLERPHVGSVERLTHGRGVGWHEDELDVSLCQSMEGQELLTHVHEEDSWSSAAIGVHDSGVQPCERVVGFVQCSE